MGILDTVLKVGGAILQSGMENQARKQKELQRKVKQAERYSKVNTNTEKGKAMAERLEKYKQSLGGKTIDEWDLCWKNIGMLKDVSLTPYNHCVGLYKLTMNGEVKYIGRAIELNNGGFRKRLSDYRRESNSARKHTSGRTIHENLDKISVSLLIVGNTEEAIEITKKLEHQFIARYGFPEWNKQLFSKK
ncbi:hypothetical protein ACSW9V_15335 (plasmid) [Clostridium perfringens]|nr:hypothetical protein [Clostridium perfringens]EGT0694084.1 hypothetical protein [Clostridium perfringens]MDU3376256.1 hypothetical protein [Clostridium perfringens]MDU3534212.1 hypothetical protein [Clostridium perfringens]